MFGGDVNWLFFTLKCVTVVHLSIEDELMEASRLSPASMFVRALHDVDRSGKTTKPLLCVDSFLRAIRFLTVPSSDDPSLHVETPNISKVLPSGDRSSVTK